MGAPGKYPRPPPLARPGYPKTHIDGITYGRQTVSAVQAMQILQGWIATLQFVL